MAEGLFRKKSLDKVTSPEQLNDYVKVAGVSVWLIVISIILLLAGVVIWGVFGSLVSRFNVGADCKDGMITCYISEDDISEVTEGMNIRIDGKEFEISEISDRPSLASEVTNAYVMHIAGLEEEDWVYTAKVDAANLPDGAYLASVTTEEMSPISFIIN